jgi:Mg/Co/Ni transporter MgtE
MPKILQKKQKVLHNPDEMIISCMNGDNNLIGKIIETDTDLIVKILNQFDVNSISRILSKLPDEKARDIFLCFDIKKQDHIIRKLPSDKAAFLVTESLKI